MKRKVWFVIKVLLALALAVLLLACGISFIPLTADGSKTFSGEAYAPDIDIPETEISELPETQTQLDGKFGTYTFITETDGKRIATLYSSKQITDFVRRRGQGEWFSVTTEEALYLISDTLALLEKYDIVRVRGLDHSLTTYFGDSMYVPEELDTAKRHEEVIDLIFARMEVINSATYTTDENIHAFYTDTGDGAEYKEKPPYALTVKNLEAFPLSDVHETREQLNKYPPYGVFITTLHVTWSDDPALFFVGTIRDPFLENLREVYPEFRVGE